MSENEGSGKKNESGKESGGTGRGRRNERGRGKERENGRETKTVTADLETGSENGIGRGTEVGTGAPSAANPGEGGKKWHRLYQL